MTPQQLTDAITAFNAAIPVGGAVTLGDLPAYLTTAGANPNPPDLHEFRDILLVRGIIAPLGQALSTHYKRLR